MVSNINRYTTEYDKQYTLYPSRSYHSNSKPDVYLGTESGKMHISHEPQIQRKRRINAPYTSDHIQLGFDSGDSQQVEDDYMLLGEKNERFAPNVPYRNSQKTYSRRPFTAPLQRNKLKDQRRNFSDDENVTTPETPRIEKRPQRPLTADPRRRRRISPPRYQSRTTTHHNKYYKPNQRSRSHEAIRIKDEGVQTRNSFNLEAAIRSSANKGVQQSFHDNYQMMKKENLRDRPKVKRRERMYESIDRMNRGIKYDSELKMKAKSRAQVSQSPPKRYPIDYYIKNGQVIGRKDGRKNDDELRNDIERYEKRRRGEKLSDADEYYAKRYELGLAERRPRPIQRLSEYQTQFFDRQQRRHFCEEPTLQSTANANRSNLDQPRYLSRPVSTTEYRRQYAPPPAPRPRSLSPPRLHNRGDRSVLQKASTQTKSKYNQRSVSPPPPRIAVGPNEYTPATVLNPQRMSFPLGPRKKRASEYADSFKNHFKSWKDDVVKTEEKKREIDSSWYDQIKQLRQKAEEYRLRARGTHFSREHTAQLMSRNNRYWDPPTTESSRNSESVNGGGSQFIRPAGRIDNKTTSESDEDVSKFNKSTMIGRQTNLKSQPIKKVPSLNDRPAGKPSYDPYLILDEGASHDTPIKSNNRRSNAMTAQSKSSKSAKRTTQSKAVQNDGYKNRVPPHRLNGLVNDESSSDPLSSSIRSLASSSSLASETLERAKKRQNKFWND